MTTLRNRHYIQPSNTHWTGRADSPDSSCFFQIIKMLNLLDPKVTNTSSFNFGILGFCCDEGIRRNLGRVGAALGPDAIRDVLAKLPIQRTDITCYDAGNIICSDGDLEAAQLALAEAVDHLLQLNITPIVLGGGHEMAWGHYQGIAKHFSQENLGIVNFDAHFDMRPLLPHNQGSSGTPFLQIAKAHEKENKRFDYNCIGAQHAGNTRQLLDAAKQYATHTLWADDLHQNLQEKSSAFIKRIINDNQILYLSLCLDVFAAAYAPGVSAPQSLGLTPWQIIPLVRQLAASGKVTNYDIAELSPPFDIDNRTAKLAANFIYEIIHHHKKYIG